MAEKERGFSLIEVLVALSILMIGLVAIVGLQVSAIHYLGVARHRSEAIQIASQVMEYLKMVPVDRANLNPSTLFYDANGQPFVDADNSPLLWDIIEDGYNTWHRFGLMSAEGDIKTDITVWNQGDSRFSYLVVYAVEWGGRNGSQLRQATVPQRLFQRPGLRRQLELATSDLPEIIPDMGQIYIEVRVGWLESTDFDELRSQGILTGNSRSPVYMPIIECYEKVLQNSPKSGTLDFFPKRYVSLKTIRDLSTE